MAGFLTPDARLRVLSALSVVLPGAKLNTYQAGTTTPLATHSDSALTTPNANPVVADSGGLFGPIYLTPGSAYKLVLATSSDVTVWTQDNVTIPVVNTLAAGTGIGLSTVAGVTTISVTAAATVPSISANDFRLTLESGVAVSVSDQLAKTTLYCTPYAGNRIDLYDASGVPTTYSSAEFSIAFPAAASQVYDVFAYNNASVPTLELLAWTNDTTRATALVRTITGAYTKSGDLTRRYLGTVRTTTAAGQCEDSVVKRYVWNYSNQVHRPLFKQDSTLTWTYSTATWRQANAAAANQVDVVVGIAGATLDLRMTGRASSDTNGNNIAMSIGEDVTNAPSASALWFYSDYGFAGANYGLLLSATLVKTPAVGRHFYAWLEIGNATGTNTWYGNTHKTGLAGWIEG